MPVTGNDYVEGLGGNDEIFAGGGDDQIVGGTGADTLDGGADIDTLSYYNSASRVAVNLAANLAQFGDAQGDIISGFENLVGSNFNDTLFGTDAANVISGYSGNDVIKGGARRGHHQWWRGRRQIDVLGLGDRCVRRPQCRHRFPRRCRR